MSHNERVAEPGPRVVQAPRGTEMSCKGWQQEAALRMLMNNLDPEVAERPDDLVVYGGSGRAARSWGAFEAIVRSLRSLENNETLLVQSGKPVGIFRTHPDAARKHYGGTLKGKFILTAGLGGMGGAQPASLKCPQ